MSASRQLEAAVRWCCRKLLADHAYFVSRPDQIDDGVCADHTGESHVHEFPAADDLADLDVTLRDVVMESGDRHPVTDISTEQWRAVCHAKLPLVVV